MIKAQEKNEEFNKKNRLANVAVSITDDFGTRQNDQHLD
jgi:hypothetical protein